MKFVTYFEAFLIQSGLVMVNLIVWIKSNLVKLETRIEIGRLRQEACNVDYIAWPCNKQTKRQTDIDKMN